MEETSDIFRRILAWINSTSAEQPLLFLSHSEEDKQKALLFVQQAVGGAPANFIEIVGEKNRIKVKDIKAVSVMFSRTSEKRVIAIPHAEQLLPEASNILLKSLEEPSKNTRFFLCAPSKRSVLPTIRSRCMLLFSGSFIQPSEAIDTAKLLAKLSDLRPADPFSEEELTQISSLVHHMLLERGAFPDLFRVSVRLRDYHRTASLSGGNMKLAADILLASLAQLRNTMSNSR